MKMSLLEKGVEIFRKEHLSLDLSTQIIGDDSLVAETDALELKDPGRCQPAKNKREEEAVDEPDFKRSVPQPKGRGSEVLHELGISCQRSEEHTSELQSL